MTSIPYISNLYNNKIYILVFWGMYHGLNYLYTGLDKYLSIKSPDYNKISPPHKKQYVLSNLIKSGILFIFSIFSLIMLYKYLVLDEWPKMLIILMATTYSAVDFTSIIRVPKLQKNTLIHHILVVILHTYCLSVDYSENTFSYLISMYGIFSGFSFLVNGYLGIRVMFPEYKHLKGFCTFTYINYVICCALNWSFQIYHLIMSFHDYHVVYKLLFGFMLSNIIYDDLYLLHYLHKNSYIQHPNTYYFRKFIRNE
jgi:hypothetical protein